MAAVVSALRHRCTWHAWQAAAMSLDTDQSDPSWLVYPASRLDILSPLFGEAHMHAARLLAAVAFFMGVDAARAQEVGDARKGLTFAEKVCAECHGVKAGQTVPAAAPTFKAIANTPGMTAMALAIFFRTPHRDMPNL